MTEKRQMDAERDAQDAAGNEDERLNLAQVISSVFAAGLGVQSSKNRERDFKQGRFGVFIAAGLIFTLLFMGALFAIVQLVIKNAGH
ncbi:MAG: DUF2970 domain-containing protein [Halieaceae bacterium]